MVWLELLVLQAFAASCAVIGAAASRPVGWIWLGAFVAYFTIDVGALVIVPSIFHLHLGEWNWIGKTLSVALGVFAVTALRLPRREIGLVMPPTRSAWIWTAGGLLVGVAFGLTVSFIFRDHQARDAQTLLFQATMPGIDEELSFRGIGFALLMRGSSGGDRRWPAIVGTSLLFGFVHIVSFNHGALHLDLTPLLFVLPFGILLAVMRARSGSLLGPVLCHNASNMLGQIVSALP